MATQQVHPDTERLDWQELYLAASSIRATRRILNLDPAVHEIARLICALDDIDHARGKTQQAAAPKKFYPLECPECAHKMLISPYALMNTPHDFSQLSPRFQDQTGKWWGCGANGVLMPAQAPAGQTAPRESEKLRQEVNRLLVELNQVIEALRIVGNDASHWTMQHSRRENELSTMREQLVRCAQQRDEWASKEREALMQNAALREIAGQLGKSLFELKKQYRRFHDHDIFYYDAEKALNSAKAAGISPSKS